MTLRRGKSFSSRFSLRKKKVKRRPSTASLPEDPKYWYNVASPSLPTAAGMLGGPTLSARRDLVEQLESTDPLFDYLVQNGAIEPPTVEEIKNEKSAAKMNLALLRHLETSGKSALTLFVNALRQTGQHHLANLLDESARIKALSGSGYLSKKRHKGQISIQIEIKAIKFPLDVVEKTTNFEKNHVANGSVLAQFRNREWINLEDVKLRISELTAPPPQALQQFEMFEAFNEEEKKKQKERTCLCLCFSRMFSRNRKTGKDGGGGGGGDINGAQMSKSNSNGVKPLTPQVMLVKQNNYTMNTEISLVGPLNNEHQKSVREDVEKLRSLVDMFTNKADEIYDVLSERNGTPYSQLLRYFEQDRGVLVLESFCDSGFVIVSICMKQDQLEQLRKDYSMGKLNKDLENCLINEEVLQNVSVKGIKLQTDIDQDEFEQAEQELA